MTESRVRLNELILRAVRVQKREGKEFLKEIEHSNFPLKGPSGLEWIEMSGEAWGRRRLPDVENWQLLGSCGCTGRGVRGV